MMATPDFIRLTDAPAERPWLRVRYLRQLVAEDKIRYFKLGRLVFFDPADLDALMVEA
jgi:hypothetical protein